MKQHQQRQHTREKVQWHGCVKKKEGRQRRRRSKSTTKKRQAHGTTTEWRKKGGENESKEDQRRDARDTRAEPQTERGWHAAVYSSPGLSRTRGGREEGRVRANTARRARQKEPPATVRAHLVTRRSAGCEREDESSSRAKGERGNRSTQDTPRGGKYRSAASNTGERAAQRKEGEGRARADQMCGDATVGLVSGGGQERGCSGAGENGRWSSTREQKTSREAIRWEERQQQQPCPQLLYSLPQVVSPPCRSAMRMGAWCLPEQSARRERQRRGRVSWDRCGVAATKAHTHKLENARAGAATEKGGCDGECGGNTHTHAHSGGATRR